LDPNQRPQRNGRVVLGIRPESFEDDGFADPALPRIELPVVVVEDLGSDAHLICPVDAPRVDTEAVRRAGGAEESLLDTAVFTARVDARTAARPGDSLTLAVDPAGLYWFDVESGESLRRRPAGAGELVEASRS
jgi:multiple sugar transport system ATP-binding protein